MIGSISNNSKLLDPETSLLALKPVKAHTACGISTMPLKWPQTSGLLRIIGLLDLSMSQSRTICSHYSFTLSISSNKLHLEKSLKTTFLFAHKICMKMHPQCQVIATFPLALPLRMYCYKKRKQWENFHDAIRFCHW